MPSMTFTLTLHENGTWQIQPTTSSPPSAPTPKSDAKSLPNYEALYGFFLNRCPAGLSEPNAHSWATGMAMDLTSLLAQRG